MRPAAASGASVPRTVALARRMRPANDPAIPIEELGCECHIRPRFRRQHKLKAANVEQELVVGRHIRCRPHNRLQKACVFQALDNLGLEERRQAVAPLCIHCDGFPA
ncbi:hypothetical protein ACFQY9_29790 [Microvirga aerilata]|uniref:hypothetical protein n=1 Tax=Microvirga aerilata TaxID=670292 RepID=UPI00363DABAD